MSEPVRLIADRSEPDDGIRFGPNSPLLTVPDLVALLKEHGIDVSVAKAYRLLEAGVIPSANIGSTEHRARFLIHRYEVLDWIARGRRQNESAGADPALAALGDLAKSILDGSIEVRLTVSRPGGRR